MRLKFFLLLLLPVGCLAQITSRNLLQKNCPEWRLKQLLLPQADFHPFPQRSADWRRALPDSMVQVLIANGEQALKGSFPNIPASIALDFSRNGNRTRYENISFGKRDRLWNLVLAETVEGKSHFVDAIADGLWSIAEESFWGASAHLGMQKNGVGLPDVEDPVVDLFAAETAATLALTDYFVGEKLDKVSPLLRRRIHYEVNRRIFVPMQSAQYGWMGNGDTSAKLNNWDPWIISNYLTAVLILEADPGRRLQAVNRGIKLTDQYINGLGDDGACEEGPQYWGAAAGCVMDVLDILSSATKGGINIFNDPLIRNMGAYIYRTHIAGNYFVDVADSHPEVYPESIMVWRFGQAVHDSTFSQFGAWLYRLASNRMNGTFHRSRMLYDLMRLRDVEADQSLFSSVPDVWLPDVQLMTTRLENGIFLASHGGNNGESHNHNDVGDFIIYAGGNPVLIDIGSGTYTARTFSKDRYKLWFNTSPYHNLPAINGQEQGAGSSYKAGNVSYRKTKTGSLFQLNIEEAYPSSANIQYWQRTFQSDRDMITISDKFKSKGSPVSVSQSFMTVCEVDTSRHGSLVFTTANGVKIKLDYGKDWQLKLEKIPLVTEEEQGLKVTWRNQPITRIILTTPSPVSAGNRRYIIGLVSPGR